MSVESVEQKSVSASDVQLSNQKCQRSRTAVGGRRSNCSGQTCRYIVTHEMVCHCSVCYCMSECDESVE